MASGLPVVVSDWNAYQDVVSDGVHGFKITSYCSDCCHPLEYYLPMLPSSLAQLFLSQAVAIDMYELFHDLCILLQNEDTRYRMGTHARHDALARYSWPKVVQQYEALWRNIAAEAPGEVSDDKYRTQDNTRISPTLRATCKISDDTQVQRTPLGHHVMASQKLSSYEEMKQILYYPVIIEILHLAGEWITISDIIRHLDIPGNENHGYERQLVIYQMMWMLKQGLLRTDEDTY